MKIGILNPNWGFFSGEKTLHRWAEFFIEEYATDILSYEEAKTYTGDMIVCLNGRPDLLANCPPKEFKGIKVVHLMDHVFRVEETLRALEVNGIDFLLCYNDHDLFDPFFQHYYKDYIGKVLAVPFGYDSRFINTTPFGARTNKVVALGSVNPTSDPLCLEDIKEFAQFWKERDEPFTHKWRKMLSDNREDLKEIMDSRLPVFPQTKDFEYDIVAEYNKYKMFTTCESIMNYPSVKTFEGMACGSVLVCSDDPCYLQLGLVNSINCIKHSKYDLNEFKEKIEYYQNNEEELKAIAIQGERFVREFYNPEKIAKRLYKDLIFYSKNYGK
jgi:glycosyltransferase involved in cell wall biosynthesis